MAAAEDVGADADGPAMNHWSISDPDSLFAAATAFAAGPDGEFVDDIWDDGADLAVFTRISSNEIIYRNKRRRCKVVGRYIFGDLLGEGAFGKVKECIDKDTLERRAVKIFKRKKLKRKLNGEQNLQREIMLLKRLRHRNILRLFDVLHNSEKQKIYMILEFCVCQLKEMLDHAHNKRFPFWQAHNYFLQLMDGIEYLHSQGIVHNDIKPANLLMTADMLVKLCDLGTAEQLDPYRSDDEIVSSQGSPAFQPPEIASGLESFSGFKVDVWSCGVTLYNFVTGQYPFEGDTVFKLYDSISRGEFDVPEELGDPLTALLRGMLHKEPSRRLSVAHIKQHEWCRKRQPRTAELVPIPPRNGDQLHSLTVLPYIWDKHYGSEHSTDAHDEFITERQLNEREGLGNGSEAALHNHGSRMSARSKYSWPNCRQA